MRLSILIPTTALALSLAGCAMDGMQSTRPMSLSQNEPAGATMANPESPVGFCADTGACKSRAAVAKGAEIGVQKSAPVVEGHPLTSVVVTQCNLMVVVYMTMPDGRFLRFDKQSDVPAEELLRMAYTASRSERVEVSCDGVGIAGYEKHDAV
jgi:hypothetical protein